ncbi:unnamed protein product [Ranitomeya imitator]|uniref:Uncharacterized protein n=1 Tax=Ranitomeya imitator TaxID=111125 RepID=A0ABN9LCK0_9NEOB|nr:unnamed protein product [Ranitomeya imitator]
MDTMKSQQILDANITPSAKKLKLKRGRLLQMDNDSKHTSKSTIDEKEQAEGSGWRPPGSEPSSLTDYVEGTYPDAGTSEQNVQFLHNCNMRVISLARTSWIRGEGGCSHSSDMRTPAAVLSMLFRATTYPNVARSLCPRLVASPDQHRCVHVSPALSAKSLLHKFSAKSKKKPWYDSPSISRPNYKPHGLMSLMKVQQKENRGPNARIKILNSILYKALTGLLSTAESL